jgi:deoxyribonuclease-4
MPILGAHMSIAGGYYKAIERGVACQCDCVQLFSKNNNQWRAKPLTFDDIARFKAAVETHGIEHTLVHDSYLINLATPDEQLWSNSLAAFIVELQRAESLGIRWVVTHPGAFTSGSEEQGIASVIAALDAADQATAGLNVSTLLETTAGQGSALGWNFEQLAAILDGVKNSDRLGICVDTCHVFAAGYPLSPKADYMSTMRDFDRKIGLDRIKAFHLNDSKKGRGSRVDRHEHIGRGQLGLEPFSLLLNDRRFRRVPMYLETEKELENGVDMDVINLATLRGLVKKA